MYVLSSAVSQSQEQCLAHSWCMSYLLLHDKLYLKHSALKQHLIGGSLSGSSGLAYIKVLAAAAASSEYSNGEDLLQAHVVVGRIQCLTGYWTEGLSASLADCWPESALCFLPRGLLHRAAHHLAADLIRVNKQEESQRECEQEECYRLLETNVGCNVHHFYCILFIRSKVIGSVHQPHRPFN